MDGYPRSAREQEPLPGQIRQVSFATLQHQPWFADPDKAHSACRAVTDGRLWYSSRLLAWVLMPDHWHGLLELGAMDSLPVFVQKLKANSARRIRSEHPDTGRVWERGFHDQGPCGPEALKHAARRLIAHPLRAGLAHHPGSYPYWDCIWL